MNNKEKIIYKYLSFLYIYPEKILKNDTAKLFELINDIQSTLEQENNSEFKDIVYDMESCINVGDGADDLDNRWREIIEKYI